jgi:hypothetical protein
MSFWGWLAVAFVVVLCVIIAVLYKAVKVLGQAVDEVVVSLDDLRKQTIPVLTDTRSALKRVEGANRKADALLDAATSLTGTADSATKLAYRVVSNPFVKVLAFFTGTRRAASRLRTTVAPTGPVAKRISEVDDRMRVTKLKRSAIDVSTESRAPDRKPAQPPTLVGDVSKAFVSAAKRRRESQQ